MSSIPDESYALTLNTEAYTMDSKILLKIVPKEVWQIIGDKVATEPEATKTPSKNFQGLINSSVYFRTHFNSKRNTYLFGNVWEDLAKWVVGKKDDEDDNNHSNILTCRLVCKSWVDAVDGWIYNRGYNSLQVKLSPVENKAKENAKQVTFIDSDDTTKFLQFFNGYHDIGHLSESTRNRAIVGRKVCIDLGDREHIDDPRYLSDLLVFVKKFGCSGMWSLNLEIINNGDNYPMFEFYAELCRILKECRELRQLSTSYYATCEQGDQFWGPLGRHFCENQDFYDKLRILHFPKLTELSMEGNRNGLFWGMLRKNDHVKSLNFEMVRIVNVFKCSFPNLECIVLRLNAWVDFERMGNMSVVWPKLTQLYFQFKDTSIYVEWGKLWKVLEVNWGKTLIHLEIFLPETWKDEEFKKCLEMSRIGRLKFEKLEYLKLRTNLQIYLDFLLPLKETLRKLKISIAAREDKDCKLISSQLPDEHNYQQVVEFVGYEEKMLESNIWGLFPMLESIVVWMPKVTIMKEYTRQQWKNARKVKK